MKNFKYTDQLILVRAICVTCLRLPILIIMFIMFSAPIYIQVFLLVI